jgi:hypothetical protein
VTQLLVLAHTAVCSLGMSGHPSVQGVQLCQFVLCMLCWSAAALSAPPSILCHGVQMPCPFTSDIMCTLYCWCLQAYSQCR